MNLEFRAAGMLIDMTGACMVIAMEATAGSAAGKAAAFAEIARTEIAAETAVDAASEPVTSNLGPKPKPRP
jgi:hypothetical protein